MDVAAVLRALLLTDLVDSTRLVEKLGDARAFELASRHDRVARDLLSAHGGLEIDKTDGFLLLFERPLDALSYALAYHRALAELSVESGVQLRARAGIHFGEVYLRDNDPEDVARGAKPLEVEGLAKPTAARVMSLAGGKQTLMTATAFDMARRSVAGSELARRRLSWLAHGPYRFQGVAEAVEVYEAGIPGESLLQVPPDSPKARRAVDAGNEVTLGWRPAPGLEIPRRAGWELQRQVGEGGFGEVWLAIQKSTSERRIFKFCYEADRLRSLQREVTLFRLLRETLGKRPEIVRLIDWSFAEAPYFLEAEYVDGGDLLTWAASRGGIAALPVEDRLEIVAQVAEALAAAHSVGLLHKDVKPQNVLIATVGEGFRAKLTDFGISELADHRELLAKGITVMGMTAVVMPGDSAGSSITGSHLYMAPEVAEGRRASLEADIYALGVMLYQLLVGDFRRSLGSGWRRDVEDEILVEDIAAFVDRDPERRVASAREVATRLRTLGERHRKLDAERRTLRDAEAARLALERSQRRRKMISLLAAVTAVFLVVVSILALQATRAREVAERRRADAEDLVGFLLGDLRAKLEPVGRLDVLDEVSAKAMEYFASLNADEWTDDDLFRHSKALVQIGEVRIAKGDLGGAMQAFDEALELSSDLVARDGTRGEWLLDLGAIRFWRGNVQWVRGDRGAARQEFEAYLQASERLVALDEDNPDWRMEIAYAHTNLGMVHEASGELDLAIAEIQRSNRIKEELIALDPANLERRKSLANGRSWLASILSKGGRLAEALAQYRAELTMRRALIDEDPVNAGSLYMAAISYSHVGSLLLATGQLAELPSTFENHHRIMTDLAARDPVNAEWQLELAMSYLNLGRARLASRRWPEARAELAASREILEKLVEADPLNREKLAKLAVVRFRQTELELNAGDSFIDLEALGETLDSLAANHQEHPEDQELRRLLGIGNLLLGRIEKQRGRSSDAEAAWLRALELIEPLARDSRDPLVLDPWAQIHQCLGRDQEAARAVAVLNEIGYAQVLSGD